MMFGALLMLDLRLTGVAGTTYPVRDMNQDFLPCIWVAFVVTVVTGAAFFITRSSVHVLNFAFQWKVIHILLAGINMLALHWLCYRLPSGWDINTALPVWVRVCGVTSLLLWAGVMLGGRWMGHIV